MDEFAVSLTMVGEAFERMVVPSIGGTWCVRVAG